MPSGTRLPDSFLFLAVVAVAAIAAFYAFTFRVGPDEMGVVLRFGKVQREEWPGLHFRMPYPIDEVRLPKVTRQNIVEIGMLAEGGRLVTNVPQESRMLTGDENIVEVHCVVFWRVKNAQQYLFNVQKPEITVKDVAESAIRDIVGQSSIQPLLTGARQKTEQAVRELMQVVLDTYGTGVSIDRVQLLKVDPPSEVIGAFRDVQAARADKERLQNEAGSYANRVIPEARGDAERILQETKAYKERTVAEATGQSARFLQIYEEYKKAPEVTRKRMYLETMEHVLGGADKIILYSQGRQGAVPSLSQAESKRRAEADAAGSLADAVAAKRRADEAARALLQTELEPQSPPTPSCVETRVGIGRRCLTPRDIFNDCPTCPQMVVVPAGEGLMGSPIYEEGGASNEAPQHKVTIKTPFAAGKFEITFAEWDVCLLESGCKHTPNDQSWGRGWNPVVDVSWEDAKQYVAWLSKKTELRYRLLSETEWEYVARAGTVTAFSNGQSITDRDANFDATYTYGGSEKSRYRKSTVEVGSFRPNAFGLYDMHGNVWEWVEDCWHASYTGAPSDGSSWTDRCNERSRVLRGGSWIDPPRIVRSAYRSRNNPAYRSATVGFRVARTLD
jgi:membrane protease subunit HflK